MSRRTFFIATIVVGCLVLSSTAVADHKHRTSQDAHWRPVGHGQVLFAAPGLTPRQAKDLRKPVVVDSSDLLRDIRTLQRRIAALRDASAQARPYLRGELCHLIGDLERDLERLRRKVRAAERVTATDDRSYRRKLARARVKHEHDPARADRHGHVENDLQPVSNREFASIVKTVRSTTFGSDRLVTLQSIAQSRHFTTGQVKELARLFAFSTQRVDALIALYPRTVDPENFHETYQLLTFSNDRRRLMRRIGQA